MNRESRRALAEDQRLTYEKHIADLERALAAERARCAGIVRRRLLLPCACAVCEAKREMLREIEGESC
jgi:hypothetical protein